MIAKVSDIQSSTQKPQQFKPIFLNTALTASEISEFGHKHLLTKRKETKRRPCLYAAFLIGVTARIPTTEARDRLRDYHTFSQQFSLSLWKTRVMAGIRDSVLQTVQRMAVGHRPADVPTTHPGKHHWQ